jgi:anti-sigma regulatory factor (Ser/Thr protein kinase)
VAETRTFRFRSRPEAVSAARRALDGLDSMLEAGAFYDASLCVSELVTNAVLHADISPESELRLDVTVLDGGLRVSVTDTGPGFTPPTPSPGDESGWGLFIVDRLSDRWGVEHDSGTRVWFEMNVAVREEAGENHGASADAAEEAEARTESVRKRAVGRLRLGPQTTG